MLRATFLFIIALFIIMGPAFYLCNMVDDIWNNLGLDIFVYLVAALFNLSVFAGICFYIEGRGSAITRLYDE